MPERCRDRRRRAGDVPRRRTGPTRIYHVEPDACRRAGRSRSPVAQIEAQAAHQRRRAICGAPKRPRAISSACATPPQQRSLCDRGRHARHQGRRAALHPRHPEGARRCARGWSICPPAASRRAPTCRPIEIALNHRAARAASSPAIAARRSRPWRRRSRPGSGARRGVAGIISAGGSGGTSMAAPAMRALPVGVPKVMISTVASGNVQAYVGPSDIMMMYSVTDVQGLNCDLARRCSATARRPWPAWSRRSSPKARDSRQRRDARTDLPAVGLTMFGVTTPCVQQVTALLKGEYDCLVFHATGIGGQSMEKLVDCRPARGRHRRHHHRNLRHDDGRRAARRPRTASAPSSARACPMSARSARSTWSISARPTRCPSALQEPHCSISTIRRSR